MRDRLRLMLDLEELTRDELAQLIRAQRRALVRTDGTIRYGRLAAHAVAWDEMCKRQYDRRYDKFVREQRQRLGRL